MTAANIALLIIIFLLIGALPMWPYSQSWGYVPSGGLGLVALVIAMVLLFGRR